MNTAETSPRRSIHIGLRWRILVGFTLLFTVVFAAAYYWFYTFASTQALARIQLDLVDTLLGGANGVNADELVALAQDGQPNAAGFSDDPRYLRQLDWLDTIHHIEPRAWPYIYLKGTEEREIIYVVDLFARYDPSRSAAFLEHKISKRFSYEGLSELVLRTENGNFATYSDEWGAWVSAYAPVRDSKGNMVGGMGVDFEAGYVHQVRQAILDKVLLAFVVTYLTLFLLVFLVSRTLTRPIISLTRTAQSISEGNYDHDLASLTRGRFSDEIDTLASVFIMMVDKVRQREQTLRRQVEELKIEIDEAKRQQQVSEVVDSDFFQGLQAQARSIRERRRHGSSEPVGLQLADLSSPGPRAAPVTAE